jgi:signal transduction histidine kinase
VLQVVGVLHGPEATTWPMYLAVAIVVGLAAIRTDGPSRWIALPAGAVAILTAAFAMTVPMLGDSDKWGSWIGGGSGVKHDLLEVAAAMFGAVALCWAIGVAVGSGWRIALTSRALEGAEGRLAETDLELRVAQDRARIARDVHDSLAHSLAIVVSQAQGAAALAERDGVVGGALDDIAAVGRAALLDVRGLVERITAEGDETRPASSLADVPGLVAQMHDLGMRIDLLVLGDPVALPTTRELAVFRIVQESLTNALKHGGATSTVSVVLDWRGPGLALFVTSVGAEPLVEGGAVPGVGIRGMEERARLAGGWLRAGAGEGDEFVVTAWIPVRPAGPRGVPGDRAAVTA